MIVLEQLREERPRDLRDVAGLGLGPYLPFYITTACMCLFFALSWTGLRKLNEKSGEAQGSPRSP